MGDQRQGGNRKKWTSLKQIKICKKRPPLRQQYNTDTGDGSIPRHNEIHERKRSMSETMLEMLKEIHDLL